MKQVVKTLTFLTLVCTSILLHAQDKTYPIKTSVKPDDLKTYEVNEADGTINLFFTRKGKKHEVYGTYVFDKDLTLVTETEEEMDAEQAKKKLVSYGSVTSYVLGGSMGGIIKDNVLTVENNATGVMNIKKGYIGWGATKHPMTGAQIYQEGFFARETIKPKADNGRRLSLVAFQTDAPAEYFADSKSVTGGSTHSHTQAGGKGRLLSDASGDMLVISVINTIGTKDANGEKIFGSNIKFLSQHYSAETLEMVAETPFEFQYSYELMARQQATDGSNDLLLIMAPGMGATKQYSNPDKNEYVYLRIGKDTKIKERVAFTVPYGKLKNVAICNNGNETLIFGTSEAGNEKKFASFVPTNKQKDDQLVVVLLNEGKSSVTSLPVASLAGITKGESPYAGTGLSVTNIVKLDDGSYILSGQGYQTKDITIYGDNYAFAIGSDGKINAHYVMPRLEGSSEKMASPHTLADLKNGTVFWGTYEVTKKGNLYPKYIKIDKGVPGPVVFPGDKKYVVNDKWQAYLSDKNELIYFGNTEDNKQFWIHKEDL